MKSYIKCVEQYVTEKLGNAISATIFKPTDPNKILEVYKIYYFVRPCPQIYIEAGLADKESIDGELQRDKYTNKYMFMPYDTTNAPLSSEDLKVITKKLDELNKDLS